VRTLARNQTKLWIVSPATKVEALDSDGYRTGEFVSVFTSPTIIYLSLYPSTGSIVEQLFGKDYSPDMLACSNDIVLTKDTLLFLQEPISDYATTYDYKVDKILESLNTYQYGLRRRI